MRGPHAEREVDGKNEEDEENGKKRGRGELGEGKLREGDFQGPYEDTPIISSPQEEEKGSTGSEEKLGK